MNNPLMRAIRNNTKNRSSKQISEQIERNGGILNGFTEEELTAYWCKMPSRHIDTALEVLSDMLKNSLFDEKEMNKERKKEKRF